MRLQSRTLEVETSPIAEAYAHLARRTSTAPLLDLSQAAPNYPTAPVIAARIAEVSSSADGGRYAPSPGLGDLRAALANELERDHQTMEPIGADRVQVTAGCNQAFTSITSTLASPGDEVILCLPYYFNHDMWLKLDGIIPRYLPTDEHQLPHVEQASELIGPRTRAIVLVSPGNPSGAIIEPAVIEAFFELAAANDIALVLDETYRNFRGTTEPSHRLYDRPGWDDTLITLHSFSKDLAIPGYRVGAIVANPDVTAEALKLLDCVAICAPRIGQEAALAGLLHAAEWRQEQAARIQERLVTFRQVMADEPGGFRLASSGAFFGWIRHPFDGVSATEVVKRLILDHDVLVIPGTAFTPSDDGWLRFSFANLAPDDFDLLSVRLTEAAASW